jgi:nitrogen-specific signal transduction histidine kinase
LERIMDEQLEWATQSAPRLELRSINELVQKALQSAGEKIVRRRVRLLKNLAPDLPELLLDPDRLSLVVRNVVDHALDAVAVGGRVRIATRRSAGHVVVEVAHDGAHENGGLLEQLFVPFAASREGAPAVGLGVASQVVREHGGEIRVRADAEWSQLLSFTLPVRGNEDRRAAEADRRSHRADRRDRFPAV